jgi:hypothetical protein
MYLRFGIACGRTGFFSCSKSPAVDEAILHSGTPWDHQKKGGEWSKRKKLPQNETERQFLDREKTMSRRNPQKNQAHICSCEFSAGFVLKDILKISPRLIEHRPACFAAAEAPIRLRRLGSHVQATTCRPSQA